MSEGSPAGGQVVEKHMAVVGGKPVRGIAIMITNKPFLIPVLQNCVLPNILFIYWCGVLSAISMLYWISKSRWSLSKYILYLVMQFDYVWLYYDDRSCDRARQIILFCCWENGFCQSLCFMVRTAVGMESNIDYSVTVETVVNGELWNLTSQFNTFIFHT